MLSKTQESDVVPLIFVIVGLIFFILLWASSFILGVALFIVFVSIAYMRYSSEKKIENLRKMLEDKMEKSEGTPP